ncbi:MAG TPA: DinB family protein [Blastocatellia bacterium]|nr:DinB family protein [Blastocatellia bacterium]
MVYNSLDEIFAALATTRRRINELIADLDDEKAKARPAPDVWSIAEIIEHLSLAEGRFLELIGSLLGREAAAAAPASSSSSAISIQMMTDRVNEKFNAPAILQPSGGVPLSESLGKLRHSREALLGLRPRIEAQDYSHVTFPHPAFGPLNLYQWLAAVEFHECKHLDQLQTIRQ